MKSRSLRLGILTLASVAAAVSVQAEVRAPWLSTDRTVDCTSYATIARDLKIATMKADEEKAIALFNFFRQRVFHFQNLTESRDPIKNLNCLGYTLCGSQGTCMKGLLASVGIKARIRSFPGHTFYDAFYDGKWHGYDTFANFYVYSRGPTRTVASFEALKADPTLISDAVKEGRACPNMCPCGDDPMAFSTVNSEQDYMPLDLKYSPRNFSLRPGEEIVRSWWPDGTGTVPLHTCGTRDRNAEPFLFKFWEPYGVPKLGNTTVSYRHPTSGQINYAPDLTTAKGLERVTVAGVTSSSDGLVGEGELVMPVTSPYYIQNGVFALETTCMGEGDSVTVSLGKENGQWGVVLLAAKDKGRKQYKVRLDDALRVANSHQYWLKVAITGKAVLNHFYLRTGFLYNAMSAPHLMPGDNKVTFEVENPESLKETPVTIVYRYRDAPKWSEEKRIEKTVIRSPFVFDVKLPDTGDKLPQMLDLTWTCGKLAWIPAHSAQDKVLADFSSAEALKGWNADPAITLMHDGTGMLLGAGKGASGSQVSLAVTENWLGFKTIVIDFENLGSKDQSMVFRARSDKDNKERTDIDNVVFKGKSTMRIPVAALAKTKVNAINKIYLMFLEVPETGSKIRVNRITLEEDRNL